MQNRTGGYWLLVVGFGLLAIGHWLDCTILPTTHDQQPTTNIINPNREQKKEGL